MIIIAGVLTTVLSTTACSSQTRSAVLLVHGENAHSLMYSQDVYALLQGNNKELMIIPGASHTDLYDQMDIIPFDKLETFFEDAFTQES